MHSIYYNYLVTLIAMQSYKRLGRKSYFLASLHTFTAILHQICITIRTVGTGGILFICSAGAIYNLHSLENFINYSGIHVTKYNVSLTGLDSGLLCVHSNQF